VVSHPERRDISGRKTRGISEAPPEKRDLFPEKRDLALEARDLVSYAPPLVGLNPAAGTPAAFHDRLYRRSNSNRRLAAVEHRGVGDTGIWSAQK
jgi:hypothetical protein